MYFTQNIAALEVELFSEYSQKRKKYFHKTFLQKYQA